MSDKTIVLITGGNTGLGFETVKALYTSSQSHIILMGSRSVDKAKIAISQLQSEVAQSSSEVVPVQIDIGDDASIENAFNEVKSKYGRVDTLVNNAGGSFDPVVEQIPGPTGIRQAWDSTYSLNVTSTQVMTHTFIPLLLESKEPRILFVTSGLSSLTTCAGGMANSRLMQTPTPKGWPKPSQPSAIAYRSSKVAMNMMVLDWDRLLKGDGVKVFNISPGFLATGLGGIGAENLQKMGAVDPSVGGNLVKDVVEGKRDADTGKVINKDGVQPW